MRKTLAVLSVLSILGTAGFVGMTATSALLAGLVHGAGISAPEQLWIVTAMTALGALAAWWILHPTRMSPV